MGVLKREEFLHTDFVGQGQGDASGCGLGTGSGYGLGFGYSSVSGSGGGSGPGNGSISSSGCGYGYSAGSGYSDGSGYGYGKEIKSLNGYPVDIIDDVPTILTSIIGNVAKGFIVRSSFSLVPTFVCKKDNIFAHGETLHEAWKALLEKIFDNMPTEKRIEAFCKEFEPGIKRSVSDFFYWHHRLTGSCEQGRREFVFQHHIDIDHDKMTPEEFFELTRDSYGSDIIRQTEKQFSAITEGRKYVNT